jgi:hypothetical protein
MTQDPTVLVPPTRKRHLQDSGSNEPSSQPTGIPAVRLPSQPTSIPTNNTTHNPITQPSTTPSESAAPTFQPSTTPSESAAPSSQPTSIPSDNPTHNPTSQPSTTTPSESAAPTFQPVLLRVRALLLLLSLLVYRASTQHRIQFLSLVLHRLFSLVLLLQ